MNATDIPTKYTRKMPQYGIYRQYLGEKEVQYWKPLNVLCPDGYKRKCYIKDNTYGDRTYLGTIKLWIGDGNYGWKEIEIPGWVNQNSRRNGGGYRFLPQQDATYAFLLLPQLEEVQP